jgi:serine/threonine-protein kinase
LKWAGQILDALEYVHKCGVVHRDVNPGNIMLRTADDNVVIIDFGTIKPIAVDHGTMVGKPGFEVPEQVARGYSDEKSDIYGVGGVLFYVLTGKPPGSIGSADNLAGELSQAGASARTAKCIEQALQIDAKLRFASASAFKRALGV